MNQFLLGSKFAIPVGRRDTAVHEKLTAGDEGTLRTSWVLAERFRETLLTQKGTTGTVDGDDFAPNVLDYSSATVHEASFRERLLSAEHGRR